MSGVLFILERRGYMIIIKKNPEAEKKAGAKYVIKRNGSEDLFDEDKIVNALFKANDSTIKNKITKNRLEKLRIISKEKWTKRHMH